MNVRARGVLLRILARVGARLAREWGDLGSIADNQVPLRDHFARMTAGRRYGQ
jgi:hypothetical protein